MATNKATMAKAVHTPNTRRTELRCAPDERNNTLQANKATRTSAINHSW